MATTYDPAEEPLLGRHTPFSDRSSTLNGNDRDLSHSSGDGGESQDTEVAFDRSVENDVLPESAVVGRNLGWSSAYILIMSRVIGSGIFATPGTIVRSVGSIGLTLVLWVVGAIVAWFGLAVNLEYGAMLPRSGGDKVYLEFAYRRPRFLATVLITVQSVLLGFTASNCIVFAEYVLFAEGREPSQFQMKLLAAGLLATVITMHSCFLKAGIFIQTCLGWFKIALVIFMVLTGLFVVLFRRTDIEEATMAAFAHPLRSGGLWEGSIWNWGVVSTAFFKVWYSYNGLQNLNNVLNEVKDPVRTLKSAASTALLTACILYLLVNLAYFLVVPIDEISNSGELIAALFFERVFGETAGRRLLSLGVAVSAAGNVMVVTFSHARMIQEIARQGFLPFGHIISSTKPFNSPMAALIVHFIPSFLVICLPAGNVYSFILDVEGFPAQFFIIASSLGLIWLRYRRPDLRRPYKAFLPAVWVRIALSIALIAAPFVPRKGLNWKQHLSEVSYAFVGTTIMLFAVLYWYTLTIALPRWKGYDLEEEIVVLHDGTSITRLVKIPKDRWKSALATSQ